MKTLCRKILLVILVLSIAASCFAEISKITGTVKRKKDNKNPNEYYYYISFDIAGSQLFNELKDFLSNNEISVPDSLYDATGGSSDIGPHMSVYQDMLIPPYTREGILDKNFEFYPISGFNFWESLNKSKKNLKIWIVKILIPIGNAKDVFVVSEDGTPHMSVGAYYVSNHY